MSLNIQFFTLAMMLLSGVGMGAAFDGYRVVSNRLRLGRLWIPVFDLLYWLAATVIVFRVLAASNEGELRMYVFVGLLLGIGCYFWLFSSAVIAFVVWLMDTLHRIWLLFLACLDWAVLKPVMLLYKLLRVIAGFILAFAILLFRIVIQLVKPFWLVLKWLLGPIWRPVVRKLGPVAGRLNLAGRWKGMTAALGARWKKWVRRSGDDGNSG
ncbi:spore cortex biosynthesis protein YabQ [Paenibacillus daejeonensis]|uniref:spore cortex biosynthesis protein YabQ n=1 Tax=Paenibacillus daejeonensis TaxID=135193 RepID=UPI00037B019E|nr:spore cortex biosynthesis protein YabQ [Paenibacillus daejeonensis]